MNGTSISSYISNDGVKSYKSCRILHCETLQEYVIEQNKLFIDRLKNQSIPNYKFNGVRYLFESRVLYGHIERINNTTIFIYHDDELMV